MHHSIPLPDYPGSFVLATDSSRVDTAVIFVHGFFGDAYKTWVDFQGRVGEGPWESADLYFLQYDSFSASIPTTASRFREFSEKVLRAPEEWFAVPSESLPAVVRETLGAIEPLRTETTFYRRVVLVGHSLGGVVLREAIKDCAREYVRALEFHERGTRDSTGDLGPDRVLDALSAAARPPTVPPLLRAKLRLFAPAISGARIAGVAGLALVFGGVSGIARMILGLSRSYQELKPEKGLVGDLRQKTERLAQRFPEFDAFRADVLWCEDDAIVIDRSYEDDRDRGREPGKDHSSVCKPIGDYRKPLDLVARGDV